MKYKVLDNYRKKNHFKPDKVIFFTSNVTQIKLLEKIRAVSKISEKSRSKLFLRIFF